MKENSNKTIAINTLILYVRLAVTAITGLLVSRFALQALGINDFGIFAVVGSVISFIAIINTIMLSTSNRFIAVAIGKGDIDDINKQFNVNLFIHVMIAILVAIIAIPLGDWYIINFVNYNGDINSIVRVFNITIWGSVISFLSVPYNGLLMAKERFAAFCTTDAIVHILKAVISYLLIFYFTDKLLVYTLSNTILVAIPTFVYAIYCNILFPRIVKLRFVKDLSLYKAVLNFSIWIGYGALASIGKTQGSALIVNAFFNTAMNTALGLANTVNSMLQMLAGNVSSSIAPQITKAYAAGNKDRAVALTSMSSKIAFMFMLLVSSPFLLTPSYIFSIWLGNVPDYVILFSQLLIIDALIGSLNRGIPELVFATGNIKWYQLIVNTLFLISVFVAYIVLRAGAPAHFIIVTYIIFSIIVLIVRQIVLHRLTKINNWILIKNSYIPSIIVFVAYIPFLLFHPDCQPILLNALSISYLCLLCFSIGLSQTEREKIFGGIRRKIFKIDKNHISKD